MSNTIKFYSTKAAYGYFSNFSSHEIKLDGKKWPTSEHYFQAQKFEEQRLQTKVRKAKTPGEAAKIGRSKKNPLRSDWESVKIDVMRKAVRAKFTQHQDLKQKLLKTGDAYLIEHTTNDRFWGDGGDGKGQNWLGRILMEIREEIKNTVKPSLPCQGIAYKALKEQNNEESSNGMRPDFESGAA